jgi:hypothetical protein
MVHKPTALSLVSPHAPVLLVIATAIWAGEDDKPSGTVQGSGGLG